MTDLREMVADIIAHTIYDAKDPIQLGEALTDRILLLVEALEPYVHCVEEDCRIDKLCLDCRVKEAALEEFFKGGK